MIEYRNEELCFRNGKESTTKLVNSKHSINLYTHRQGKFHIDTIGGHYGISYLTNRAPFSYRSKLLKDWKLKRQYLQELHHGDMMRHEWSVVKVNPEKFAICPTFIYNWCVVYYRHLKSLNNVPKKIKGNTFVERYNIALDFVVDNNCTYELFDEDFERLEGFYFQMREFAFLDGMYKIVPKRRVY